MAGGSHFFHAAAPARVHIPAAALREQRHEVGAAARLQPPHALHRCAGEVRAEADILTTEGDRVRGMAQPERQRRAVGTVQPQHRHARIVGPLLVGPDDDPPVRALLPRV